MNKIIIRTEEEKDYPLVEKVTQETFLILKK